MTPEDAARAWQQYNNPMRPKHRLHYEIKDVHCCTCGAVFDSYYKLLDHTVKENPSVEFVNPVVDEGETFPCIEHSQIVNALGAEPIKQDIDSDIKHTWYNWESFTDGEVYRCKCGELFHTHSMLMAHTAENNPSIESYQLGRAGAAIERSAHEKTIQNLKRAVEILKIVSAHINGEKWAHGPDCKVIEGTTYIDCRCNLKKLCEVQCKEIEPFLRDPDTWA